MSRAFVKEDDQEEAPFIPPRAPLPAGATNYVTPTGMQALLAEKEELEKHKETAFQIEDKSIKRREISTINGKLNLLEERINSARILNPEDQPQDEVRFGAKVILDFNGKTQKFQLVGVDEANVKEQKIAFTSPIAKAITGKKVGKTAELKLGNEIRNLKVLKINY